MFNNASWGSFFAFYALYYTHLSTCSSLSSVIVKRETGKRHNMIQCIDNRERRYFSVKLLLICDIAFVMAS